MVRGGEGLVCFLVHLHLQYFLTLLDLIDFVPRVDLNDLAFDLREMALRGIRDGTFNE